MKKFLTILTVFALVLTLVACGAAPAAEKPEAKEPAAEGEAPIIKKVALVTDVGTIDDESFNQACWQGVKAWSEANKIDHKYYQPTEDSNDARMLSISQAIQEGANVVVLPGFLFDAAVAEVQDQYPDVYFIAVDVASLPNDTPIGKNAICITLPKSRQDFWQATPLLKTATPSTASWAAWPFRSCTLRLRLCSGRGLSSPEMETDIEINILRRPVLWRCQHHSTHGRLV